jgi:hypothetical protein
MRRTHRISLTVPDPRAYYAAVYGRGVRQAPQLVTIEDCGIPAIEIDRSRMVITNCLVIRGQSIRANGGT